MHYISFCTQNDPVEISTLKDNSNNNFSLEVIQKSSIYCYQSHSKDKKEIILYIVPIKYFKDKSIEILRKCFTSPRVLKYNPGSSESNGLHPDKCYENNYAKSLPLGTFLVIRQETSSSKIQIVGLLKFYENQSFSIGFFYYVIEEYEGQGLGTLIVKLLIKLLQQWKVEKKYNIEKYSVLEAVVHIDNTISNHIIKKFFGAPISTGPNRTMIAHTYEIEL